MYIFAKEESFVIYNSRCEKVEVKICQHNLIFKPYKRLFDIRYCGSKTARKGSLAVFILQTYNASGRLWARHFSASFCSSFNLSRKKTGERRTIRQDELNRLMPLSPVSIRDELNDEQNDALKCLAHSRPDALYVCSIKTANLGVKTCDVFLCFATIVVLSILLPCMFSLFYISGDSKVSTPKITPRKRKAHVSTCKIFIIFVCSDQYT